MMAGAIAAVKRCAKGGNMRKNILILAIAITMSACASLQNYNALSSRDKAFYNLLWVENQKHVDFAALTTQQERDEYLSKTGYLQKFQELPEHVQKAVVENEVVKGAPEFTVYMAAGRPIKENKQVSMEEGDTKILFYLRCAKDSGANAGKFVPNSGFCAAAVSSVFASTFSPAINRRDPLLAEAISYVIKVKDGKVVSVETVEELPR